MQIDIGKTFIDKILILFCMLLLMSCTSKWYQWLRIWQSINIPFVVVNVRTSARNNRFQTNYRCITRLHLVIQAQRVNRPHRDINAYSALMRCSSIGLPVEPTPEHAKPCPDGWHKYGAFCYLPFPHTLTWWHDAEQNCQKEGGIRAHLPTITK